MKLYARLGRSPRRRKAMMRLVLCQQADETQSGCNASAFIMGILTFTCCLHDIVLRNLVTSLIKHERIETTIVGPQIKFTKNAFNIIARESISSSIVPVTAIEIKPQTISRTNITESSKNHNTKIDENADTSRCENLQRKYAKHKPVNKSNQKQKTRHHQDMEMCTEAHTFL
jgi:hypothetical protein